MEKSTLELIAKLTKYKVEMSPDVNSYFIVAFPDKEMINLGESIFIQSNPSDEDINNLNDLKGLPPIMTSYEKEIGDRYLRDSTNLIDILNGNRTTSKDSQHDE